MGKLADERTVVSYRVATGPSTCPLSLPLHGRPTRSANRSWLTREVKAWVHSRSPSPQIFATAIFVSLCTGSSAPSRRRRRTPKRAGRGTLGRLCRIGRHEEGSRLRQVHAEQARFPPHRTDHGHRLAKIHRCVARWMRQGYDLAAACLALPDTILHHGVAAVMAVLVGPAPTYSVGGVAA